MQHLQSRMGTAGWNRHKKGKHSTLRLSQNHLENLNTETWWESDWLELSSTLGFAVLEHTNHVSELSTDTLKGIVHPKMKILLLITHPYVVPNL